MRVRRVCVFAPALCAALALASAAAAQPPRESGVHYLYLVRHGEAENERGVDPATANGLTPLGREQARLAGARLASLSRRPQALVTSSYLRARQTADEIAPQLGLAPVVDTLIHECAAFSERTDSTRIRSPERAARCDSNLTAAWRRYFTASPDSDRRDVLVCHANVIRWFVARVLNGESSHWTRMEVGNASITVIAVLADGSARLVAFSDTGHLPLDRQTWTGRGSGWGSSGRSRGARDSTARSE